jgi:hypothetical protein
MSVATRASCIGLLLVACSGGAGTPDGGGGGSADASTDPVNPGTGTNSCTGGGAGTVGAEDITLPNMNFEHITGFCCSGPNHCVVATDGGPGHLYASDGHTITGTIFTGDAQFAEPLGTFGTVGFSGFSHVGDRVIVGIDGAAGAYVSAAGDVTAAASWTVASVGKTDDVHGWGLNQQMGLGTFAGKTTMVVANIVLETTDAPGPAASWKEIWAPIGAAPIPADLAALRAADPTICTSEAGASNSPHLPQSVYVAADRTIIVSPAGAKNQRGSDSPGVCISTDGGHRFHHVAFTGLASGPSGISCTSKDHCVAFADVGITVSDSTAYVFVTNDATKGAASTWTAAALPGLAGNTNLRAAFFAGDGSHGWLIGWTNGATGVVYTTSDGGAHWTDSSAALGASQAGLRLFAGHALDTTHAWVGGEVLNAAPKIVYIQH